MSIAPSPYVLQVKDLGKHVSVPEGELTILADISFDIAPGESVAVVGTSGAGKSTLLGILAGLDVPTSGEVLVNGEDFFRLDEDGRARVRGRLMGFVFQSFQLLPSLTALENVMLPLELANVSGARDIARQTLARVGLEKRTGHYPRQLSGGEQQRVAIARAFAPRPKVLFADEPTGNLDSRTGQHIIDLLFSLNQEEKTTLVLVTHDTQLAGRCSRLLRLEGGRLMEGASA
jgi:putative ABC transport system ATP-binding protein